MAKFIFGKKIKDKENTENTVMSENSTPKADNKGKSEAFNKLVDIAASGVNIIDDISDEMGDIGKAGSEFIFDIGLGLL